MEGRLEIEAWVEPDLLDERERPRERSRGQAEWDEEAIWSSCTGSGCRRRVAGRSKGLLTCLKLGFRGREKFPTNMPDPTVSLLSGRAGFVDEAAVGEASARGASFRASNEGNSGDDGEGRSGVGGPAI